MGALQFARGRQAAPPQPPNVTVIPYSQAVRMGLVRPNWEMQRWPVPPPPLSPYPYQPPLYQQVPPQTIPSLYPQVPPLTQVYPPYPSFQVPYPSNVYTQQIFGSYFPGMRRRCVTTDLSRLSNITGLSQMRILNLYKEFLATSECSPIISRCQFRNLVSSLVPTMNTSHIQILSNILFEQVDRDRNGVIDFFEFVSFYRDVFADEVQVENIFSVNSSSLQNDACSTIFSNTLPPSCQLALRNVFNY